MVATTSGAGVGFGPAQPGGRVSTKSSPVQKPGGGQAGEDAYRSSKRRIPKGPDPIHNSMHSASLPEISPVFGKVYNFLAHSSRNGR
ncbi:unnamed protein product [Triticum turgidum subsp. durum]|uniref:Uncharacterized protein n=1 Tax=Triticum turgidum subsp. durum TaxID=4567 RepID=A0A9R0QFA3_TRITD|nr:unnamed protein product [Triticum turgidum subsp. durum]